MPRTWGEGATDTADSAPPPAAPNMSNVPRAFATAIDAHARDPGARVDSTLAIRSPERKQPPQTVRVALVPRRSKRGTMRIAPHWRNARGHVRLDAMVEYALGPRAESVPGCGVMSSVASIGTFVVVLLLSASSLQSLGRGVGFLMRKSLDDGTETWGSGGDRSSIIGAEPSAAAVRSDPAVGARR